MDENLKYEKLKELLETSVSETIENIAFMEVTPSDSSDIFLTDEEIITTSLMVCSPVECNFKLSMPKNLLIEITQTIYSPVDNIDNKIIDNKILDDTLSEILNTIAGRFLNKVLPENQEFKLGVPEIIEEFVLEENERRYNFNIEGEEFFLVVSCENLLNVL